MTPLADGGYLVYRTKYATNSFTQLRNLQRNRQRYILYHRFQRWDPSLRIIWSVDIDNLVTNNDSISTEIYPVANFPNAPNDALFIGARIVNERVTTEPTGQFALVGRINGIGTLYDPLSLARPATGPRARPATLTAYPNPTREQVTLKGLTRPTKYRILDPVGRLISEGTAVPDQPISLTTLPRGIYMLECGGQSLRVIRE